MSSSASSSTSSASVALGPHVKAKAKHARLDAEPNIVVLETRIVDNAACAARPFTIGETVFREDPLILIQKERIAGHEAIFAELERIADTNFLGKSYLYSLFHYQQATQETRDRIQEFFCPELDDTHKDMQCYQTACKTVCELPQFTAFTPKELIRYLLILRTNQHASGRDLNCSALYELGSKVTHSCDPNCLCIMDDVIIEYRAIRPIKMHEMLTFSYIGSFDLWKATPERRRLMRPARFFDCCCSRCVGPDFCRRMRCPACGDHRTLYHQPGQPSFVPTEGTPTDTPWKCFNDLCGKQFADSDMPLPMEERLTDVVVQMYFRPVPGQVVDRDVAKQMLLYVAQELGHYHWLSALMLYTQLALSHSAIQNGHARPDPPALMLEYCEQLMYWFEVCYAGSMEEANICHFIGDLAKMLGDTTIAARAFTRALPLLRCHWTPTHPTIHEMEEFVMAYGEADAVHVAMIPYERQVQIVERCKAMAAARKEQQLQSPSVEPPAKVAVSTGAPSGTPAVAAAVPVSVLLANLEKAGKLSEEDQLAKPQPTAVTAEMTTNGVTAKQAGPSAAASQQSSKPTTTIDGKKDAAVAPKKSGGPGKNKKGGHRK